MRVSAVNKNLYQTNVRKNSVQKNSINQNLKNDDTLSNDTVTFKGKAATLTGLAVFGLGVALAAPLAILAGGITVAVSALNPDEDDKDNKKPDEN